MQNSTIHSLLVDARVGDLHHAARASRRDRAESTSGSHVGHRGAGLRARLQRAIDQFAAGQGLALNRVEIVGHSVPAAGSRRS